MKKKEIIKLTECIHEFFTTYLKKVKGASPQTNDSYKNAFSLFLPFAAKHLNKKINSLKLDDLKTDLILSFLEYLETSRKNSVKTRNLRLSAIKSMAKRVVAKSSGDRCKNFCKICFADRLGDKIIHPIFSGFFFK